MTPNKSLQGSFDVFLGILAALENEDEGDVEQACLDEAERRLAAYRRGETTARPAEDVFEAILSRY
jgi:hypothetical protein